MQNKRNGGINIGTSLILVIFVLLSLVTFAALSYLSAKSDYTLSKEAAGRTASYYDANRMAEIYLANIEGLLSKHLTACDAESTFYDGIDELFTDNDKIEVCSEDDGIYLEYMVPITNGQDLMVRINVHYPTRDDGALFHIDRWSTAVNDEWLSKVKEDSQKSGIKFLFE